jgi:L-alanine-DL-glutamate epimerase-like enolase superfamily enzyme
MFCLPILATSKVCRGRCIRDFGLVFFGESPYYKDKFRINEEGYVLAPTEPGLGYPLDRDALDKMTKRIDR